MWFRWDFDFAQTILCSGSWHEIWSMKLEVENSSAIWFRKGRQDQHNNTVCSGPPAEEPNLRDIEYSNQNDQKDFRWGWNSAHIRHEEDNIGQWNSFNGVRENVSLPIYDFHVAPHPALLTRLQLFTKTGYLITFFIKLSLLLSIIWYLYPNVPDFYDWNYY